MKTLHIIAIMLNVINVIVSNQEIVYNTKTKDELKSYLLDIFSECPKATIVVSNEQYTELVWNFLCPSIIYSYNEYEQFSVYDYFSEFCLNYNLFIDIHNEIYPIEFLKRLLLREKTNGTYDPLVKILVIWNTNEYATVDLLTRFFELFWEYHYANVGLIIWNEMNIKLYNYDPFLKTINHLSNLNLNINILYPKNKLNNFQLAQLRIQGLVSIPFYIYTEVNGQRFITGINKKLTNLFVSYFNATEKSDAYVGSKYYYTLRNKLYSNESDISVNSRLTCSHHNTTFLYPVFRNDLCIIVPESELKSTMERMKKLLSAKTWILFSITMTLSIMYRKLQYYCDLNFVSIQKQLLISVSLLTNVSINFPLKSLPASDTVFLTTWMFCAMLISFIFNALFFNFLAFPSKYPDLDTPKDINNSGKIFLFK